MTKRHFIALADAIKARNRFALHFGDAWDQFNSGHLETLADFCKRQNPKFDRDRWLKYVTNQLEGNS